MLQLNILGTGPAHWETLLSLECVSYECLEGNVGKTELPVQHV